MIEKKKSKLFIYFRKILMGLTLFIGFFGIFNITTNAYDTSQGGASGQMGNMFGDIAISGYVGQQQFMIDYDMNAYEISSDSLLNGYRQIITYEVEQEYLTLDLQYDDDHWYNSLFGAETYWVYSYLNKMTFFNNSGTSIFLDNFNLYVGSGNTDYYEFYDNGLNFVFYSGDNGAWDSSEFEDYYFQSVITFNLEYRNQNTKELVVEPIRINNFVNYDSHGFSFNLIQIIYDYIKLNYRTEEGWDRFTNGYFNISDCEIYLKMYDITSPTRLFDFTLDLEFFMIDKSYRIPNINVYAGQIQDTLNVDFTTWISTATNGFLSFEIVPGLSIIGILSIIVSFSMLILIVRFFGGH